MNMINIFAFLKFIILVVAAFFIVSCSDSNNSKCMEPENPYNEGTGQYAGFKWAEENNSAECSGNSDSFNEGCEEYNSQEDDYEACSEKSQ